MGAINERMFKLLEQEEHSQKDLALYLGIEESTLSTWKKRGTDPPSNMILKIAEYFQVPARYLIEGDIHLSDLVDMRYTYHTPDDDISLNKQELGLCAKYRKLTRQHKDMINAIINIALDEEKYQEQYLNSELLV